MISTAAARIDVGALYRVGRDLMLSWLSGRSRHEIQAGGTSSIIALTKDAAAVNAIINDPSVFPSLSLGAEGPLDITSVISAPRNLCFLGRHGGALLVWTGPGIYEAHDFILPEGRGKWAKQACSAILAAAFNAHGAKMVWAQTPVENRPCRIFNRALGFRSDGIEQAVLNPEIGAQAVEIFVMEAVCL